MPFLLKKVEEKRIIKQHFISHIKNLKKAVDLSLYITSLFGKNAPVYS